MRPNGQSPNQAASSHGNQTPPYTSHDTPALLTPETPGFQALSPEAAEAKCVFPVLHQDGVSSCWTSGSRGLSRTAVLCGPWLPQRWAHGTEDRGAERGQSDPPGAAARSPELSRWKTPAPSRCPRSSCNASPHGASGWGHVRSPGGRPARPPSEAAAETPGGDEQEGSG